MIEMQETTPSEPAAYRQDRAPWGWLEIVVTFLVVIVALVGIFTALAFLVRGLGRDGELGEDALTTSILLTGQGLLNLVALGVAAALSLGKFRLGPGAWGLVWPPRLNAGLIFAVLGGSFAALILYGLVTSALGLDALVPESNVPDELFNNRVILPLTLVFVLIVAPLTEEMFFRGFVFHGFWSDIGFWPAAIASGAIFSVIHVTELNLIGLVIPFTVIGILLAWLVRRTGSLWNAIAVHFLFNAVGVTGNLATGALL